MFDRLEIREKCTVSWEKQKREEKVGGHTIHRAGAQWMETTVTVDRISDSIFSSFTYDTRIRSKLTNLYDRRI